MTEPRCVIEVLLVDDHEVVREGFRRLLQCEDDIRVVAEAADGQTAYREYAARSPDVTVMDLSMPGISGFETSRRILARDPGARILVFSVHEAETYLGRVLDMGILGYISKRSAAREMIEAVRRVANGERYVGEYLLPYAQRAGGADEQSRVKSLSAREFEVFCHLAEGEGVERIAASLSISPKTVGNHYTQIKKKLGAANAAELTLIAVRAGIIAL